MRKYGPSSRGPRRPPDGTYQALDLSLSRGSALPPRLQSLLWLWAERRGAATMPPRDTFSPKDLRDWIGNLALIETEGAFRFRLCGTNLIPRFGREATGAPVEELAGDIAEPLCAMLSTACATGMPVFGTAYIQIGRERFGHADLALPMAGPSGGVAIILFASYPLGPR
jgi:hypothetical protein